VQERSASKPLEDLRVPEWATGPGDSAIFLSNTYACVVFSRRGMQPSHSMKATVYLSYLSPEHKNISQMQKAGTINTPTASTG
jgi:hypothetical protein